MRIRKFTQLIHHEIFTTGLADDGTIWKHEGGNFWIYEGEAPQLKNPEIRECYFGGVDDKKTDDGSEVQIYDVSF